MSSRRVVTSMFQQRIINNVTLILNASDNPQIIGSDFAFATPICLIYAEKIKIENSVKLPGKHLEISCTELDISPGAVIDVSGRQGMPGGGDAADGDVGEPGGHVSVFVQKATATELGNLSIRAYGGDGGSGRDATANRKLGGKGGNGGDGGKIEVLFGTITKATAMALATLRRKSWPRQVKDLLHHNQLKNVLGTYDDEPFRRTIENYAQLSSTLQSLAAALQPYSETNVEARVARERIARCLQSVHPPPEGPDSNLTEVLGRLTTQLIQFQDQNSQVGADAPIAEVTVAIGNLEPVEPSYLGSFLETLALRWSEKVGDLERLVASSCSGIEAGVGGSGGRNSNPLNKPGLRGKNGQDGHYSVINMRLNGSRSDLDVNHVFAFPDQCQMLLDEANREFFSPMPAHRDRALVLYERLLERLSFMKVVQFEENTSRLADAYQQLTGDWGLTLFAETHLQSILQEATSRLNRLMLGQDMWGHTTNWVPRMSVTFYEDELNRQLTLLLEQERLLEEYGTALQSDLDTQRLTNQALNNMRLNAIIATNRIRELTADNGPLATSLHIINALSPLVKMKRDRIQERLKSVELESEGLSFNDRYVILDALTIVAEAGPDMRTACNIMRVGFQLFESVENVSDSEGYRSENKYVVKKLSTCGDTVASLQDGFLTNMDDSMTTEESESLILTTIGNTRNIMEDYKHLLPHDWLLEVEEDLDDYVALVKSRNAAVLEYNSSLQLPSEARADKKYSEGQIQNIGQQRLSFDPTLPAVAYWQSKYCNSLNYQSRAIRYWSLHEEVPLRDPMPLQNWAFLSQQRESLRLAFSNSLQQYSRSTRNTWPLSGRQPGLVRFLTEQELTHLKGKHFVYVDVSPTTDRDAFANHVDIRLSQVRLWLPGASVALDRFNRRVLTVFIVHLGQETMQDIHLREFNFFHDPVQLSFQCDMTGIVTNEDIIGTRNVVSSQAMQADHYIGDTAGRSSIAAVGPFAKWKIVLPTDNVNQGLDLEGVKQAFMEFWGSSRSPLVV